MKVFWWIVAGLALVVFGVAEWRFVASLSEDIRQTTLREPRTAPYDVRISGSELTRRTTEALVAINASRLASLDKAIGAAVVVENVVYERASGVVHAQGRLRDLAEARRVLAVMDAYDGDMGYLTSAATPVQTARGAVVPFSVAMPDRVDLSTLSFRILSEVDRSEIISLTERDLERRRSDVADRAILLADDPVLPVDLQEAEARLRRLGYVDPSVQVAVGEPAMKVLFNRFRKDHGLPPTGLVDIETLLALRVVTAGFQPEYVATL